MTDFISASPLLILLGLAIISWLTDSKILKLATAGIFFLYPVMLGKVKLPNNPDQIIPFIADTIHYWLAEALNALIDYIKQQIFGDWK